MWSVHPILIKVAGFRNPGIFACRIQNLLYAIFASGIIRNSLLLAEVSLAVRDVF